MPCTCLQTKPAEENFNGKNKTLISSRCVLVQAQESQLHLPAFFFMFILIDISLSSTEGVVRGPRTAKMSDITLCSDGGSWGHAEPRWEVCSPVGGSTGCLCNLVEGSIVSGLSETLIA